MKFNKFLALGLSAFVMTACSDSDDSYNTSSDVTVSFGETSVIADEDYDGTMTNIPIVVDGQTNGKVTVTLEITETTAIEDVHFYVTTKTLNIGEGDKSVNFEFHPTGDDEVNEDRSFTVSIVKAEGATIGANSSCEVKLLDDDYYMLDIYPKLLGQYTFTATNQSTGAAVVNTWTMTGVEEGEMGFPHTAVITGLNNVAWAGFEAYVGYSPKTGRAWMRYQIGQLIAENVGFTGLGNMDVQLCGYDGGLVNTGSVTVNYDADLSTPTVSFGANQMIGYLLLAGSDTASGYLWFRWGGMSMTKIAD